MSFLNPFKIKKIAAMLIVGFMSTLTFIIANMYIGYLLALGAFMLSLLIFTFVGSKLLQNPFSDILEGNGVLILDFGSPGIITPFIVKVKPPYLTGKLHGKDIQDIFDRDSVMQLATPSNNAEAEFQLPRNSDSAEGDKGTLVIRLTESQYNDGRFALYHWPVLIYNHQIGSIVTKSFLANNEHESFAKHLILYLSRRIEELDSRVRDFSRYVIETLKPKTSFWDSPIAKWILIAGGVALLALLGPMVIKTVQGFIGGGGAAVSSAANAVTTTKLVP